MSGVAEILDRTSEDEAAALLYRCCGCAAWVGGMLARRPFHDDARLFAAADEVWGQMSPSDVLEALSHHPKIGASMDELRKKFASTAAWAAGEQAGAAHASDEVLEALREGNRQYDERFGHVFVVCATGRSASEMLASLRARLGNDPAVELGIAAAEQAKITRIRLEKIR